MEIIKEHTKVKVIKSGRNAYYFSLKDDKIALNGIYSISNWENKIFKVLGTPKEISFKHAPKVFCAYPIGLDDTVLGWVYNDALEIAYEIAYDELLEQRNELLEALKELYNSCNPRNVIKSYKIHDIELKNYVGACGIPSEESIHKANDLIQKLQ